MMDAFIAIMQESPIDYLDYGISGLFALFFLAVSGWVYLWTRHTQEREKERDTRQAERERERDAHQRELDLKMMATLEKHNEGLSSITSAMMALKESFMASAERDREACAKNKNDLESQLSAHEGKSADRFTRLSDDHDELRGLARENLSGRQ